MAKKKIKLKKKYVKLLRKLKFMFRRLLALSIIVLFIVLIIKSKTLNKVEYKDANVIVDLHKKNLYCILSSTKPSLDDKNWIKANNKKCTIKYKEQSNLYIKSDDKIVYSSNNKIEYYELSDKELIYLPINGTYDYIKVLIGDNKKVISTTSDDRIVSVDQYGNLTAHKTGTANISIEINDFKANFKVIVTDLITNRPNSYFDYKKPYLSCKKYSSSDNDLIDEILEDKIKDAGYQTRAGVVEAARFLTLDFPYRINYFHENGRQTTNNVDGEGRYYHKGLYLDSTRYENITGSSTGPSTWGCNLYSNPIKKTDINGMDCSGFVSWCLLNAGFDVKDIGAGFSNKSDLTDFGELVKLTKNNSNSSNIKVGDLLHSNATGGHIAIIIGMDGENYYIAQALWYDEVGVIITKRNRNELYKEFTEVVLMDKYYKKDGNLTDLWY